MDQLHPRGAVPAVEDGETLSLGGKTLRFIHIPGCTGPRPWSPTCEEDRILFSCDFFGSHLATSDLVCAGRGVASTRPPSATTPRS